MAAPFCGHRTEGAARLRIVVGTVESNPIIGAAARAGQIDVGPDNPW